MPRFIFLCEHDRKGAPKKLNYDYTELKNSKELVSKALISELQSQLTKNDRSVITRHPDWIRKADLLVSEETKFQLSFVSGESHHQNALSYYVYDPTNPPSRFNDVKDVIVIFPNTGVLSSGDTMTLPFQVLSTASKEGNLIADSVDYTFPPGCAISFVLHNGQWKKNGRLSCGHHMLSSDPILNPEQAPDKQHHFINFASQVEPGKIWYGVEGGTRDREKCDPKFNDLVFFITPRHLANVRGYNSTRLQSFEGTILCEECRNMDLAYNNIHFEYKTTELLDEVTGNLLVVSVELTGYSRGTEFDHEFGFILPKLRHITGTKVYRETFASQTGTQTFTDLSHLIIGSRDDKVPIVQRTNGWLSHPSSWLTNTLGNTVVLPSFSKVTIEFPVGGVSRESQLGNQFFPYNFYLRVFKTEKFLWEWHSVSKYPVGSKKLKTEGIKHQKKLFLLPGVTNFRIPVDNQPLRYVYHKLKNALLGNRSYRVWYQEKWARTHLLHPKPEYEVTHSWKGTSNTNNIRPGFKYKLVAGNGSSDVETSVDLTHGELKELSDLMEHCSEAGVLFQGSPCYVITKGRQFYRKSALFTNKIVVTGVVAKILTLEDNTKIYVKPVALETIKFSVQIDR